MTKAVIMSQDFLKLQTSNRQLSIRERKCIQTADDYTPAVSANWAVVPTKQDEALDALAAAVGPTAEVSAIVSINAATATITAGGVYTSSIVLPANAVVSSVIVDEKIAIAGNAVVSIIAKVGAVAISASYTTGTPGVSDKSALVKLAAGGAVTLNFATVVPAGAKPTSGSINVIVKYTLSA